jgi:DNA processing protein
VADREVLARQRLALVLAGGGVSCRRALVETETDNATISVLSAAGGFAKLVERATSSDLRKRTNKALETAEKLGFSWVIPGDSLYPGLVNQISDPPLGLFIRGAIPEAPAAAIVGSRRPTKYGEDAAVAIAREIARENVVVVSGMARGVDAAAHRGSLVEGGPTVAVWGTGPDKIYPPEHRDLADEIALNGALVTEYPPGTPPRKHHFPQRNRLIAGLVAAVVVVEASARSGALVTARIALEENREVLAVPGSIFSELSVGPNALLRAGARPLVTPRDLLTVLGAEGGENTTPTLVPPEMEGLLGIIGAGEMFTVDELSNISGNPVQEVLRELLELELRGAVQRHADGRYGRL